MAPHQEEEYTDYSCSTAIERLSRDVETILRTWHVDRGSDHHVSSTIGGPGVVGGSKHQRGTSGAATGVGVSTMPFRKNVPGNIQLIRSAILPWNLTMTTFNQGRSSVTIDLELALWDAPSSSSSEPTTSSSFTGGGSGGGNNNGNSTATTATTTPFTPLHNHLLEKGHHNNNSNNTISTSETASVTDGEEELSSGSFHKTTTPTTTTTTNTSSMLMMTMDGNTTQPPSTLVRSLRRKPFGKMPSHDFLFDNFSTLFGIGQHISLTPVQPEPIPDTLLQSIGRSISHRHDVSITGRWVLASTLSQWLQTALNVATANCHTCIPTFGVWGQYRPNQLAVSEPTPKLSSSSSSSLAGLNGSNSRGSYNNNNNSNNSGPPDRNGKISSSSVGSVGVRSVSFKDGGGGGGGGSSHNVSDVLVGRTIRAASNEQQQLPNRSSSFSSTGPTTTTTTTTLDHKRYGVQLFPHWAQACKKTILPQDGSTTMYFSTNSSRNGEKVKNRQFSPPFVVGNVLVPSSSSSTCRQRRGCNTNMNSRKQRRTGHHRGGTSNNNNESTTTAENHPHPHTYKKGANMWVTAYSMKKDGSNNNKNSTSTSSSVAGLLAGSARLSVWAGVLIQHCPPCEDTVVVLSGGRHVFGWFKERTDDGRGKYYGGRASVNNAASFLLGALGAAAAAATAPTTNSTTSLSSSSSPTHHQRLGYDYASSIQQRRRTARSRTDMWRSGADEDEEEDYHLPQHPNGNSAEEEEGFAMYRRQCQDAVLDILEEAWGCKDQRRPLWGSIDDPVASVYATTTWNGQQSSGVSNSGSGGSNNNEVNSGDNDDVVEPLLTFPLRIRSRRELSKQDYAEMEESVERTVLDPMNPSRFCVQAYFDRDTDCSSLAANQRCTLAALIRAATLPNETLLHHLTDVELMNLWDDDAGRQVARKVAERAHVGTGTRRIVDAMDWSTAVEELISVREAEYVVHAVLDGTIAANLFPSSPEDAFIDENNSDNTLSSFRKSAPFGRLVSVLFAHMARLRALSSIALVWRVFCQELRRRWEGRESLPNMQYVPGLDPHPLELYEKRCFSTIGLRANFAAFLNCTEPDPDDFHCLIGQKLQVFNLSVECLVAEEILENEAMELFLGAGQVPSSLAVKDDDDDDDDDEDDDDEILRETRREGLVGGGGIVVGSTIPESPEQNQNFDTNNHQAHAGSALAGTSQLSNKWPKARNNTYGSATTGGGGSGSAIDKENQAQEKVDYGPPTIDRDLDFWVMDEPGYTPVLDEGVQFAEDPLSADTDFDYCISPPDDDDDDDANEAEKDDDGAEQNTSIKKQKKDGRATKDNNKKNNIVVEGLPHQAWEGTIMDGSDGSVGSTGTLSQAYFDAAEAGSIFSTRNGFIGMDTVVNVADMQRRPGARCPVLNATLRSTGDQLYAPYLQRPHPLTDDVVLERKIMLAKTGEGAERRGVLQSRIEVAHRLQKPKLLSDMRAFKAANPKCTLDDFARWYGNPGSPLDDYNDDASNDDEMSLHDAHHESAAKKLDKASEAMRVLVSLRDFWGKTWEEALPIPAAEQDPLFDYSNTVEMVLDYLEQLHPANLMNQVVAVNLSSAYFALASSAKATMKIGIVQLSLKRLRQKTEKALKILSRDSTGMLAQLADGGGSTGGGSVTGSTTTSSSLFASLEAICACEEACNALGIAETMIARATSLLHKFPGQYKLISDLLRFADGSTIPLIDRAGRTGFMNVIFEQQQNNRNINSVGGPSKDGLPDPILREYVFRNLDDENPCQLAVRFGNEGGSNGGGNGGDNNEEGVLLALMKAWSIEE